MSKSKTFKALSKNIALQINNEISKNGDCCVETFAENYLSLNQKYLKLNNFNWKLLIDFIKIDLKTLMKGE